MAMAAGVLSTLTLPAISSTFINQKHCNIISQNQYLAASASIEENINFNEDWRTDSYILVILYIIWES